MSERSAKIIVQKYGGSSLADAEKIRAVAERICAARAAGADVVVAVSAMGDGTDELINLARDVVGDAGPPDPRELDTLLSTGELVSSALVAMAIRARGHDVVSLSGIQAGIKTDSRHGSARIANIDPTRIQGELARGRIVVVAGFQGLSDTNDVTTLGRGASDTTAVALAAALGAERCEIYTDVDGIYTADPRLVPDARKLDSIEYGDMLELASLGAKMNPRSIELGAIHGVPIMVASTFDDVPGTLIHGEKLAGSTTMEIRNAVTAVESETGVAQIAVSGLANREGLAAELFDLVAAEGVNVDVIIANDQPGVNASDLVFTVSEEDAERAAAAAAQIPGSSVQTRLELAKVSIAGTGMQNSPGYAARMFRALANANVNIHVIATAEVRITCVIDADRLDAAATALAQEFDTTQITTTPSATDARGRFGSEHPVTGIAIDRSAARISVRGVRDRPGIAAGLFEPLADAGISVDLMVQTAASEGMTDMAFTVAEDEADRAIETARQQKDVEFDDIIRDSGLAKVSIVGAGLQYTPGQAAKMFRTLGDQGINIRAVTTADIRITCLVDAESIAAAARSLHDAFDLAASG
ncbi:MAG: aspartate kinase [Chloroflexi bacterium]|nr:aspartate kinase [Chloroflexota bacterium]MCH8223819.1 aspartate kinase [Chloroflexota bacterium]